MAHKGKEATAGAGLGAVRGGPEAGAGFGLGFERQQHM